VSNFVAINYDSLDGAIIIIIIIGMIISFLSIEVTRWQASIFMKGLLVCKQSKLLCVMLIVYLCIFS
jgi:predicted membrane protein